MLLPQLVRDEAVIILGGFCRLGRFVSPEIELAVLQAKQTFPVVFLGFLLPPLHADKPLPVRSLRFLPGSGDVKLSLAVFRQGFLFRLL